MTRPNLNVLTVGVALVLAGIVLSMNTALSDGGRTVDYRDIAAQLTRRGAASAEGVVAYRRYQFRISTRLFDQLADVLAASQRIPQPDVGNQIKAWLKDNLPWNREAWSGMCALRSDQWQDKKKRISGVDTTAWTMRSLAAEAAAVAAPMTNAVVKHSNGITVTTIKDGKTVIRNPVSSTVNPLVPLDISLASWQDAIDLGANVEGQEIHGYADGQIYSITYINSLAGGSWVATEYSFDANLGWAPTHVRSYDQEGAFLHIAFGYARAAPEELIRPCVVAKGEILEGGDVDATVWIIDEWLESCNPALVELREPALYLELDFMADPNTPIATVHEPDYLIGIEPSGRLRVALINVINAFGTHDRDADYTYDGIVDANDIEAVLHLFGSSGGK